MGKSPPKTFYFGMDVTGPKNPRDMMEHQMEQIQARLNHTREMSSSPEISPCEMDDVSNAPMRISRILFLQCEFAPGTKIYAYVYVFLFFFPRIRHTTLAKISP